METTEVLTLLGSIIVTKMLNRPLETSWLTNNPQYILLKNSPQAYDTKGQRHKQNGTQIAKEASFSAFIIYPKMDLYGKVSTKKELFDTLYIVLVTHWYNFIDTMHWLGLCHPPPKKA